MPDFDGAPATPGATVLPRPPAVPLPGAAHSARTAPDRAVALGSGTLGSEAREQLRRPVRRRLVGPVRELRAAQSPRPLQPLPAGRAPRDVPVQSTVRHTGRFAVEAGGQSGTELRASHATIVPHFLPRGTDRVGGRRG
ncbi:hypothetical protein GCM10009639_44780 [Kitasatospora putterlickiae]|uniref:Uncharacterized protein n=1 Tax=Kitasatospora putterlickiae TaxID=221725 RepID=A0ABN1YBN2_9ACTN